LIIWRRKQKGMWSIFSITSFKQNYMKIDQFGKTYSHIQTIYCLIRLAFPFGYQSNINILQKVTINLKAVRIFHNYNSTEEHIYI
jgi:hypothetical protein